MDSEIWKDVVGYESLYMVSNKGRVKTLDTIVKRVKKNGKAELMFYRERINKPANHTNGYKNVCFTKNRKRKCFLVHRVVAIAFIPNPEDKAEVNHIDFDRSNNSLENLEWASRAENIRHSVPRNLPKLRETMDYCRQFITYKARCRPVVMMDKSGNVLREFSSIKEASMAIVGRESSSVGQCVRHPLTIHTAYGHKWAYKEIA